MNLSFKDTKFILEAVDNLLVKYNTRLEAIEESEDYEDEASDLGNDCMFLEALKSEIEDSIDNSEKTEIKISSKIDSKTDLESLTKSTLQLSINERLLLVEAITQSIRKETNLIAS